MAHLCLLPAAAGDTMQRIIQAAVSAGYQVRWRLLNAGCYSLAEVRREGEFAALRWAACLCLRLHVAAAAAQLLLCSSGTPPICHSFNPPQHRRRLIVQLVRHDVPAPSFPLPYTLFPGAGGYQEPPGQPCLLQVRGGPPWVEQWNSSSWLGAEDREPGLPCMYGPVGLLSPQSVSRLFAP